MSKELEACLNIVGANYPGCHNCKHYRDEVSWEQRGVECATCVPSMWKPNEITKMKLIR